MALTDSAIKALKPSQKLRRISDGGGLYIEVAPTGVKTFRLAYRFKGVQRTRTLGVYPDTRLAQARVLREEVKGMVMDGRDPRADLKKTSGGMAIREGDTWRAVTARYLEKRAREGAAPKTMQRFNRYAGLMASTFGHKTVSAVRAADVLSACRVFEAQGKVESANAVRILCSQVFRFAIAHGLADSDPAAAARDALARPRSVSYAAVTDPKEVGKLMRAIRGYPDPVLRTGLLLSAYLIVRGGELRQMRWDQIRDGVWQVPAAQMKMKREHLVPLPRQVRALLQRTRTQTGGSDLVLYTPTTATGAVAKNAFNDALRKLGYTSSQHVHHGFRTTASTNLNEMGWNADWIERQLAHVSGNKVRGVYNKALYL